MKHDKYRMKALCFSTILAIYSEAFQCWRIKSFFEQL